MSEKNASELIPEQESGVATNTESSISLGSVAEAKVFFKKVRQRLLEVNNWHQVGGTLTATFRLTDKEGNEVNRAVQKLDHFKIDIPGPGTITGDGYDWVQVEEIEQKEGEEDESITIRVRPATNPTNDKKDVAHFFDNEATSSFMVKREYDTVTAGVYGRNEKPNTAAESIIDKSRNIAIATGAVSGFAKFQWKSLVNGLVSKE